MVFPPLIELNPPRSFTLFFKYERFTPKLYLKSLPILSFQLSDKSKPEFRILP